MFRGFITSDSHIWQDRDTLKWHLPVSIIGNITGDFELFTCTSDGHAGGGIEASMESFTGESFSGGEVSADVGLFTCESYAGGFVESEFQIFNGTGWGNTIMITASFQPFSADYPYGISGQFSYNTVKADMAGFTANIDCGGHVTGDMAKFGGTIQGFVGVELGVSAAFNLFTGVSYGGGTADGNLKAFTGNISGEVTHIDRITGTFSLFDCDIHGNSEQMADIAASMKPFVGTIKGTQINPAQIVGSFARFNGSIKALDSLVGNISGSFFLWGGQDRIEGIDATPVYISGSFENFNGEIYENSFANHGILGHIRGEVR